MAFAQDMGEYLKTSELSWSRALIRSFVKEIEIPPGKATIQNSTPVPEDSLAGGRGHRERPERWNLSVQDVVWPD